MARRRLGRWRWRRSSWSGFAASACCTRQGTPQECAELVLFLASDEASFISGAEIAIDGGYIAAGIAHLRHRVRDEVTRKNS